MKTDFILPEHQIYMAGHSLGPLSKSAQATVVETLEKWGAQGVSAWNQAAWIDLPQQTAVKIAALIGTSPTNVIVSDATSVNLYKVLMSALRLQNNRHVILTTSDNFPADRYIAQGIEAFHPNISVKTVNKAHLEAYFDESVAVLLLTEVNYRDSTRFDMVELTRQAHQQGILTVWDLSHSVGMVPLHFDQTQADFAVGCTYKYLSGGPGSPAFIAVNSRHLQHIESPIFGWMGHCDPFAFRNNYRSLGCAHYLSGTPYILSMSGLIGALSLFDRVEISDLYQQSLFLSEHLIQALEEMKVRVVTPLNSVRGGHIAFMHPEAYAITQALLAAGLIGDYREPNLIRLCVNPLYLDEIDLTRCIAILQGVLNKPCSIYPRLRVT